MCPKSIQKFITHTTTKVFTYVNGSTAGQLLLPPNQRRLRLFLNTGTNQPLSIQLISEQGIATYAGIVYPNLQAVLRREDLGQILTYAVHTQNGISGLFAVAEVSYLDGFFD